MISIDNREDIIKLLEDDSIILIDVRTKKEYEFGHLDNAINIDVLCDNFAEYISKFDKDKNYFIYCASGVRSKNASNIMKALNFKYINNSKFGYDEIMKIIQLRGKQN